MMGNILVFLFGSVFNDLMSVIPETIELILSLLQYINNQRTIVASCCHDNFYTTKITT